MAQVTTAQVTTVGIDIAKNVVCIHGVDARGHVVVKKRLARQKVLPFMASCHPALLAWKPRAARITGRGSLPNSVTP